MKKLIIESTAVKLLQRLVRLSCLRLQESFFIRRKPTPKPLGCIAWSMNLEASRIWMRNSCNSEGMQPNGLGVAVVFEVRKTKSFFEGNLLIFFKMEEDELSKEIFICMYCGGKYHIEEGTFPQQDYDGNDMMDADFNNRSANEFVCYDCLD